MNIRKWISFLGHLVFILVLTSFGKSFVGKDSYELSKTAIVTDSTLVTFPKIESQYLNQDNTVFLQSDYQGFKEALAFKESQGNYAVINTLGYMGKYQFGVKTLKMLGVNNPKDFIVDPILQERIFELNVSRNKWILRREIKSFAGKRIKGTVVSESGMIAAAHLAGAGNVQKYLKSYGKKDIADAYGTSLAYYLKRFGNYDISLIKSIHNPKI